MHFNGIVKCDMNALIALLARYAITGVARQHLIRKERLRLDTNSVASSAESALETTPPLFQRQVGARPPASGGSLTREQFLLPELRMVAAMRLEGYSDQEIVELSRSENIFQYPTTRAAQSIAKACLRRLSLLEQPDLQRLVARDIGTPEQAAQINLYAMARTYRLMNDFLSVEIAMRYLTRDYTFGPAEMNYYFANLTLRNREAATWSDATIGKLKQVLRKSLAGAGLLETQRSCELQPLLLDPVVQDGMEANGDFELLPAFGCMTAHR